MKSVRIQSSDISEPGSEGGEDEIEEIEDS